MSKKKWGNKTRNKKRSSNQSNNNLINQVENIQEETLISGSDTWHYNKLWFSDGPVGLTRWDNGTRAGLFTLPCPTAIASTFSVEENYLAGKVISMEMERGVLLAPAVNLKRNPYNGRNFEYYSEDPILCIQMGLAFSEGVEKTKKTFSCFKHYALNNQENYRLTASSNVDEETLFNNYLLIWHAIFRTKPRFVMLAYNKVNGTYCTENEYLIRVAREFFGFDGTFISDWGAVSDTERALKAGLDIEMPDNPDAEITCNELLDKNDEFSQVLVDKIAKLKQVTSQVAKKRLSQNLDYELIDDEASAVAMDNPVLLRNDGILPLHKFDYAEIEEDEWDKLNIDKNLYIVGLFGTKPRIQGEGSSKIIDSKVEFNISEYLDKNQKVVTIGCYDEKGNKTSDWDSLKKLDQTSQVIVFIGNLIETECVDRDTLALPPIMDELVYEVVKYSRRVIVVLQTGCPVLMPWVGKVNAIVQMHLGGMMALDSLFSILSGGSDFKGHLTETYPISDEVVPVKKYRNDYYNIDYKEGSQIGYKYYEKHKKDVLFPFGFGLSYVPIEKAELIVPKSFVFTKMSDSPSVKFSVYGIIVDTEYLLQIYLTNGDGSNLKFIGIARNTSDTPAENSTSDIPIESFMTYDLVNKRYQIIEGDYLISIRENAYHVLSSAKIHISSTIEFPTNPVPFVTKENGFTEKVNLDTPIIELPKYPGGDVVYQQLYELIHSINDPIGDLFYKYAINLPIRAIGSHLKNNKISQYLVAKLNGNTDDVEKLKSLIPENLR